MAILFPKNNKENQLTETATFGAGCFWGVELKFSQVEGVISTMVGYMGGQTLDPTYEEVCTDTTGHAEVVQLEFDPQKVTYEDLVDKFFKIHDPTQLNRQGFDAGRQYRSVVFYHSETQKELAFKIKENLNDSGKYTKPVVTEIFEATQFYKAEEYHQQYLAKRGQGACGI